MTIDNDPNNAPSADSTRYYKCDGCQHLHVMLVDAEDNVLATAVMSREMLLEMLEVVDGDADDADDERRH